MRRNKKNNTNQSANTSNLFSKEARQVIESLVIRAGKIETVDVSDYKSNVNSAKSGSRIKLYNLYDNVLADPVLADAVDKLTGAVTNAEIMFQVDGQSIEEIEDLMDTPEFERLLKEIALKFVWGKSVIECFFAPQFNVFSIPRKNIRVTNFDKPLSERKKFIAAKESDTSGYDYTQDEFIIECGDDDDLGLLFRAALFAIYKRGGWGDWSQFIEKFAMPFVIGEYEGFDENTQKQLFNALANIGSNPFAAVPKGVRIQVHDSKSSASGGNYDGFTDKCDRQILIALLGNTMTTMEGSSRAQGEVHQQTQEERYKMIRRYTQRILNRYFVPLLIKRGYKATGGFFSFPDAGESISTKERLNMGLEMKKAGLPVDEDWFFEISGVAKAEVKKVEQEKSDQETEKNDSQPKVKEPKKTYEEQKKEEKLSDDRTFLLKLADMLFQDAPTKWSGAFQDWSRSLRRRITGKITLDDGYTIDIDKLLKEAIKEVYGNNGNKELINKNLFDITNNALQHAIDSELEDNITDKKFIRQFKENAAVFAAFKNHKQTELFVKALYDNEDKLRSFREFRKECLKIGEKFNEQYLQTEYNTAVRAARMAANLKKYERTAHLYPNLEYIETNSSHPRMLHLEYVGTILPIHHKAWSWLMPPSDWNCDCSVRPTDKEPTAEPVKPENFNLIFDNNPVESAEFVNTKETPYYKHTDEGIRDRIEEEGKKLFKEYKKQVTEHKKEVIEIYKGRNGGMLEIVRQQGQERDKNMVTYKILADDGGRYTLLKPINADNVKNPDAFNYLKSWYSDAKHPVTEIGKNAIQRSIRDANKQGVQEIVIRLDKEYPSKELFDGFRAALQPGRASNIKTIILIRKDSRPMYLEVSDLIKRFSKG